jgi:hypothetical protein
MVPRVAFFLILLASACTPAATAISVGPGDAPRPRGCDVRHERLTPKDAEDRYRQVGVVCWSHGTVEDLNDAACGLGGEIVVRTGLCSNGQGKMTESGVEYGVYTESR